MNYDELGDLREADWGALARDEPERPPDRRRPPAPTPSSEERERRARRDRAERRARRIGSLRDGETLDEVAHRLGVGPDLAEDVYDRVSNRRELTPEQLHALGAPPRRRLRTCAEAGLSRPLARDQAELDELLEELRGGFHVA